MKRFLVMVALLFATLTVTTAQTKMTASKVRITRLPNAKALGTDEKGNVIDGGGAVDELSEGLGQAQADIGAVRQGLTAAQNALEAKLDKGVFDAKTAEIAEDLAGVLAKTTANKTSIDALNEALIATKQKLAGLAIADVGGLGTELTRLENLITTFQETDPIFSAWDKDYADLTNKPTIPDVSGKVDKVAGKDLSTNDYTDGEKAKLANTANKVYDLETVVQAVSNKPESDPIFSAWDKDYADLMNKPTIPDVSGKVDKVAGKGLSTNDYTDGEKAKLTNTANKVRDLETAVQSVSGKAETDPTVPTYVKSITQADITRWNTDNTGITNETDPKFTAWVSSGATKADVDSKIAAFAENTKVTHTQYLLNVINDAVDLRGREKDRSAFAVINSNGTGYIHLDFKLTKTVNWDDYLFELPEGCPNFKYFMEKQTFDGGGVWADKKVSGRRIGSNDLRWLTRYVVDVWGFFDVPKEGTSTDVTDEGGAGDNIKVLADAKTKALADLVAAAQAKKEAIVAMENVSAEEKNKAKGLVDIELDKAKKTVNTATSSDAVATATTTGITAINGVTPSKEVAFERNPKGCQPYHKYFPKDIAELKTLIKKLIKERGNNADLNDICTSEIETMYTLFNEFTEFNGDISKWDVSNVKTMGYMFSYCQFSGDISKWDVSGVVSMGSMFRSAKFNGDISKWDVSSVQDMAYLFSASSFEGDISEWNVSNVTNMNNMFSGTIFNGDISKWDVSNVQDMSGIFNTSSFNGDISKWNVSKVNSLHGAFKNSEFSGDISKWEVGNACDVRWIFDNSPLSYNPPAWYRP